MTPCSDHDRKAEDENSADDQSLVDYGPGDVAPHFHIDVCYFELRLWHFFEHEVVGRGANLLPALVQTVGHVATPEHEHRQERYRRVFHCPPLRNAPSSDDATLPTQGGITDGKNGIDAAANVHL